MTTEMKARYFGTTVQVHGTRQVPSKALSCASYFFVFFRRFFVLRKHELSISFVNSVKD